MLKLKSSPIVVSLARFHTVGSHRCITVTENLSRNHSFDAWLNMEIHSSIALSVPFFKTARLNVLMGTPIICPLVAIPPVRVDAALGIVSYHRYGQRSVQSCS